MGNHGHLSQVSNFASTTSSGNLNLHLSVKHDIQSKSVEQTTKILGYLKKYSDGQSSADAGVGSCSFHELNRDILIWFCRDLLAFDLVEREGFKSFFMKVMPQLHIPSPDTLASTALEDVYQAIRGAVKTKLESVNSICLMFDGWTDRYKARPYMGVRISFLEDWELKIVTLGCHVLPSHTARAIADHISMLLKDFFPDPKKLLIFTCHDGAANMMKTSKLLKVDSVQHCISHSVHLLLTTDSINALEEVTAILTKCRNIVTALHFKNLLIEDELSATKDKALISKFQSNVAAVNNLLDLDDQFSDSIPVDKDDKEDAHISSNKSLKASCPTRWNSVLLMIQSIVDLQREVDNSLKRNGQRELCLHEDELDFLKELIKFLTPFKNFTELFGSTQPTLSVVPIVKMKIRKICKFSPTDDSLIKSIKAAVLANVDKRFPDCERITLHQLLDPQTKNMVPRTTATTLLEGAVKEAIGRHFISLPASVRPKDSVNVSDDEEPAEKKRRLRLQLLQEFRSEMQTSNEDYELESVVSSVTCNLCCYC